MPSSSWTIPRETVEWIGPVTHTPGEGSLELAILPRGDRPVEADWQTPTTLDGGLGLMLDTPEPGTYYYWARIADNPETPVVERFATILVT